MKMSRLLTIIAVLSLSLLVFLIAFNSVILGDDKASESTTEMLLSQIQDLRKEIEALKERISKLESEQKIPPAVPQVPSPTVPEDLPSIDINPKVAPIVPPDVPQDLPSVETIPKINQLPKGSVQKEINGMTYYIIPLQDQSVDK